ncbi:hypothetical protein [Halococcus sp. PRR34]|uniref:hypothetical protein n=1 Tax=Halococcus sp. PRR34 TaxID=3020830 RepID=UPI00235E2560|nr:hypothetical protein [Halococcus sp. PRR34]
MSGTDIIHVSLQQLLELLVEVSALIEQESQTVAGHPLDERVASEFVVHLGQCPAAVLQRAEELLQ